MRILLRCILAVFLIGQSAAAGYIARPRLIIFISIDQMRADYLERFKFSGGFKRLISKGAWYTNADLNYASSETGPGHATLSTGCYPGKSGILSNEWIDPETKRTIYCVEDSTATPVEGEGGYRSPANLVVQGLGDWLKASSPGSRVIAVSSKDRAAVLMGGKRPTGAFWYDGSHGRIVTSSYYMNSVPDWVKQFNAEDWITRNVPNAWVKSQSDDVYAADAQDEFTGEFVWGSSTSFPHAFATANKTSQILTSPYGDMLTLDFAVEAARSERLGMRGVPDLLCVSLSCTDYVGHNFGPNSQEIHDHLLRLDKALDGFLNRIDTLVGQNVVVALSADHAVMPLPEYETQVLHHPSRRIFFDAEIRPVLDSLNRTIQLKAGTSEPVVIADGFLNYSAVAGAGMDSIRLENAVAAGLKRSPAIADVYFRRELIDTRTPDRPYLSHFRRSYFPGRGEDFQVRFCEHCLVTTRGTGTSHGSTYRYDTHVPVVFLGSGIVPGRFTRRVHTVDVAPTLARMLNTAIPSSVDGTPLKEVYR